MVDDSNLFESPYRCGEVSLLLLNVCSFLIRITIINSTLNNYNIKINDNKA